jgi:hypothetical protein
MHAMVLEEPDAFVKLRERSNPTPCWQRRRIGTPARLRDGQSVGAAVLRP